MFLGNLLPTPQATTRPIGYLRQTPANVHPMGIVPSFKWTDSGQVKADQSPELDIAAILRQLQQSGQIQMPLGTEPTTGMSKWDVVFGA